MHALVCRAPGELALDERPEPERADTDVLVQVRRVGVCGTDFHIFEGSHPYLEYPRVIGHELGGEVLEAASGSAFRPGQTVVVNPYLSCGSCLACRKGKPNCCMQIKVLGVHRDGGMCERIAVPEANLYAAGNLSVEQAATTEFLAIGAHAVARSGLGRGAPALVVGAGPIGLGTALFATMAGGDVTIMDYDRERLAVAVQSGIAARAIKAGDGGEDLVAEATGGDGFDLVFDATGSRASMEESFGHVAHGGTLVMVGVVSKAITFSDPEFHKREMMVLASRNALRSDFERVMTALEKGLVPVDRLLTHRTTLAGAVRDIPQWASDKKGLVKALVEIG